jgi:ribosomal-protein-alanine N-acetyltransferase
MNSDLATFGPVSFPELHTRRFRLRRIVETDLDWLLASLSDPEVVRYYGVSFYDQEGIREQLNWYDNLLETGTGIWWAISTPQDPALIGAVGMNNLSLAHRKAEVGFWLLPAYWKQGVIKEAFQQVLDYAFMTLELHRLEAWVETENVASMKVLEKQGFRREGTLVDCEVKNDRSISLHIYARLKT